MVGPQRDFIISSDMYLGKSNNRITGFLYKDFGNYTQQKVHPKQQIVLKAI